MRIFSDKTTNPYFTLGDGLYTNHGAYGANYWDDDVDNGSAEITFTVLSGKKAILSYDIKTFGDNVEVYKSGTYIHGERAYVDTMQDEVRESRHYTHYKILSEGQHTIKCTLSDSPGYVFIDNLKVEILSTAKPTLKTTLSTQEGDQKDWLSMEGSFQTPNGNISYGAQTASYQSVSLPYTVKDVSKDTPIDIEYTQTVPAGYMQKGFAYPHASNYNDKRVTVKIADYTYEMFTNRPDINSGNAVMLGTRAAGTYKHRIDAMNYKQAPVYIHPFDIIQYPCNEATLTDDISFNDSFTRVYFPKESSAGRTNLSICLPKGEYLLKNLKIYYIENGQKIYLQNKDLDETADLSAWTLSSGLTASIVYPEEEETDDKYIKIYKKGEKVLYNIFYSDYESDPSKAGYWVYSHVNWPPDGIHPDVGKVLTAPIDRFYLSGKYTVTHWEVDNTQRTGTVGDASSYDKESDKVDLTFYVNGEGEAPWITYIKTNPVEVKENNSYTIKVGVDDTEKDTLTLETEVYFNGKSIFNHRRENLQADAYGDYPETLIGGLPAATPGVYQVVCTVSDCSGTGVKSYKFIVVSEGKITGSVNHTDQWDANRKKYNLKRFCDEVNRSIRLNEYIAMPAPRMRGTNVFWSGEKFMLRAETEGSPTGVSVQIFSADPQGNLKNTGYLTELTNTGRTTPSGAGLWEGSLWDSGMINRWGRKVPEELTFRFTANYPGGLTKIHTVTVIIDSDRDYWQLHRLW